MLPVSFYPGTILIFFLIRIWDKLKQNRVVKASLEGINAASAGVVTATGLVLFWPISLDLPPFLALTNIRIIIATVAVLIFTKIPPPYIFLPDYWLDLFFDWNLCDYKD